MWFRRDFFFPPLAGAMLVGSGNLFPLTHSTSIMSAQVISQPGSHRPVLAQRSLSPKRYLLRGPDQSPPRCRLMVFIQRILCKFFVEGLRSCTRTRVPRSSLNTRKCHGRVSKSFLWWCAVPGKSFQDVKHRYVLFLPLIQCQGEPVMPNKVNGDKNKFPNLKYSILSYSLSQC